MGGGLVLLHAFNVSIYFLSLKSTIIGGIDNLYIEAVEYMILFCQTQ